MIQELDKAAAQAMWPDLQAHVARALEVDPTNALTLEDVASQIDVGYARVLLEVEEGNILGVVIVQCFALRGRRTLHVLALTGVELDQWLPGLIDYLRGMCADQEADGGVTMIGRPGWMKKLLPFGFRTEQTTMRMEVDYELREEPGQPAVAAK
jgi:hypothetical protein